MIDGISRIYHDQVRPAPGVDPAGKKAPVPARQSSEAGRPVPDLKDKVEISEQGRKAAEALGAGEKSVVPGKTLDTITGGWYRTGFRLALEEADSLRR